MCKMLSKLEKLIQKRLAREDAERARYRIPLRAEKYRPVILNRSSGDTVVEKLRDALESFEGVIVQGQEVHRSSQQREFHEAFIAALARYIYPPDEYKVNATRILTENGWESTKQEVAISCPRRFGKSYSVSMFAAACLAAVPSISIAIFSPSKKQSIWLKETIEAFMYYLEEATQRVVERNTERITCKYGDNDIRRLSILSSIARVSTHPNPPPSPCPNLVCHPNGVE